MLTKLASHNPDIQRLIDKGYAVRIDGAHLVVRDIPYLDGRLSLQRGAFVAKLVFIDSLRIQQDDHQVYFAGGVPHGLNGSPIPNLAGGPVSMPLSKTDVVVERSFSNKPPGGFPDFFAKIEHYIEVISGPAIAQFAASPLTKRIDLDGANDSVFTYPDTLTSRAEIGDLVQRIADDDVAVIGLGGTGGYLLDFLVKSPVKRIRGFDGDAYHVHNAYRSPGALADSDLGLSKSEVYRRRYDGFRKNLSFHAKYIDHSCANDFDGVTFAFVCVDKGPARAEIIDLLIDLGIPFIDVGMGLDRKRDGLLSGQARTTYFSADDAAAIREKRLVPVEEDPDNIYRLNIQIAECNALNACVAVLRYKQIRGIYSDDNRAYNLLTDIATLKMFGEAEL